jgi:cytochrome P450
MTCDPDVIRKVLVDDARAFVKRTLDLEVLGNGLLTSDGETWRRHRRMIQPGFRHEAVARYGALMQEELEQLLSSWSKRRTVELRSEMMALTLRIVCRALFGQQFAGNPRRLSRAMHVLQDGVIEPKIFPRWAPTPGALLRRAMRALVDRDVYGIIDAQDRAPGTLLADLCAAADDQGALSRRQLRDEVVTLFLAGHETTALALTWTFYLLALHRDVAHAVRAEARSVAGSSPIGAEHYPRLELTARVVHESMRLYPPVYVIPRVAGERVVIDGVTIPKDAEIWLWTYFVHHDARWYPRPERFDPTRFLPDVEATRHPHAYLPFGAGTRSCVGKHFALLEAVLTVASVMRRVDFEPVDSIPLRPRPRVTLAPERPVVMRITT